MIITAIRAEQFMCHARVEIRPEPSGVTVISGPSGSGKSALVADAVGFCLYGLAGTRAKRIEDLRSRGASGQMRCEIEIEVGGDALTVIRGQEDGGRTFARLVRGHEVIEGARAVEAALAPVIGHLDASAFHQAVICRQDEVGALARIEPERRREVIHRALGLQRLRQVEQRLGRIARDEPQDDPGVMSRLARARFEEQRAQRACAAARAHEETAAAALARAERAAADTAGVQAARDAYARARAEHQMRMAEVPPQRPRLAPGIRARARRYASAQIAHARAQEVHERYLEREERLRELREAEGRRRALGYAPDPPERDEVAIQEARLEEAYARGRAHAADLRRLREERDQVLRSSACSNCHRPFDDAARERHVADIDQREAHITARIIADRESWARARGDLVLARAAWRDEDEQRDIARRARQLATEILEIRRALSAPAGAPDDAPARAQRAERARDDARAAVEAVRAHREAVASYWRASRRLRRAEAARESARAALKAYPRGAADAADLLHRASLDHARARAGAQAAQERAERITDHRTECEAALAREEEAAPRREAARRARRIGHHAQHLREEITAEVRPQLAARASSHLARACLDELTGLRIDEDDALILIRAGQEIPIRLASGGEAARVGIALRLALSEMIRERAGSDLSVLVLDEALQGQDAVHRDGVLGILDGADQVIVVSHDPALTAGHPRVRRVIDLTRSADRAPVPVAA